MLRMWMGQVLSLVVDPTIVLSFSRPGYRIHSLTFDPADLAVGLAGRRCVITGANQGIGYEAALGLAAMGAEVVLACRNPQRGAQAAGRIRDKSGNQQVLAEELDVSSLASVQAAAARLQAQPIDVLVHNAGMLPDGRDLSPEGLESTMATHVVGPHLLTKLLLPALSAQARVIWVSSGGMYSQKLSLEDWNWDKRTYDGVAAYAQTKRMQVVLAELWARELAGRGVTVNSMHPGWADTSGVRTSIPRFYQMTKAILRSPAEGADTIVWLAASAAAAKYSGRLFLDRQPRSTRYVPFTGETSADQQGLWRLVEQLSGRRGAV